MKRLLVILPLILLCAASFQLGAWQAAHATADKNSSNRNPVVFWELASNDGDASVTFFRAVFDWDIRMDENLGFYAVRTGGRQDRDDGYIFTLRWAKLPFMAVYTLVDDIEATAQKVEEAGGHIVEAPTVVLPGGPQICLFNDPSGTTHAMIQLVKEGG
jgi:predicted enzyme related to lactoylglutathione lyase